MLDETERFWTKVDKSGECWLWTAGTANGRQYGHFHLSGTRKAVRAHRYSYELANGTIPGGLVIDHVCHVKLCVNPAHLRAVTVKQNNENRQRESSCATSGIRGVHRRPNDRWEVKVQHHGRKHYGGTFKTLVEAEAAAIALRNKLFTHNILDRPIFMP